MCFAIFLHIITIFLNISLNCFFNDYSISLLRESGLYGKWSEDILEYKHNKTTDGSLRHIMQNTSPNNLLGFKTLYFQNVYGLCLLYIFGISISILFITRELINKLIF